MTADEIRHRMTQIRGELDEELSGILANAKRLASWRFYLHRFPKTSLAVAACLGYLVIPRRKEIVAPDAEALEKLSKKYKLVVEKEPKVLKQGSLARPVVKFALSTLLRVGVRKAAELYGRHRELQNPPEPEEAVNS